jgi:phospholipid transport system substrate-binding protein
MTHLTTRLLNLSHVNRRAVLGGLGALALVPRQAFATTTAEATALVDRLVVALNSSISSGRTGAALHRDFENIFSLYADAATIARSVLGVSWRTINDSQRRNFTTAFQSYMARKYGRRFLDFQGWRIEVARATVVNSYVEVSASAIVPGSAPLGMTFLITERGGIYRFFDIRIGGVSLRRTEREEIGAMLDQRRGDVDQLIAHLQTL